MAANTIYDYLHRQLPTLKIAVLGDVMLDRYIFGEVNRISPESPVPVNLVKDLKEVLGGAANVANNLAHLDCEVHMGGIIGDDDHGTILEGLLRQNGIDGSGLVVQSKGITTTKTRILGEQQQMMRLDYEDIRPCDEESERQLLAWLTSLMQEGLQGLVISDYGKGVCTPSLLAKVLALSKQYEVFTIVDPKGAEWTKYNGATCITPNVKELSEVLGYTVANEDEAIIEGAKTVLSQVDLEAIVVTRSAKGITLVKADGQVWHSPATQQEVFDVSGAGDTVVAMIISAFLCKLTVRAALLVSNAAAGIVVSKVGTYPIHREELLQVWDSLRHRKQGEGFVYEQEELAQLIRKWQDKGDVVVFTNGCFDILHRGHLSYLKTAATLGDHLIVAINSDASVQRLKGESRPINSESDRALMMSSLGFVDGVVIFEEDTPAKLLSLLRPNILVKGGDYKVEEVIGRESVDRVEILPFQEGYSTTGLIEKIKALVETGKV